MTAAELNTATKDAMAKRLWERAEALQRTVCEIEAAMANDSSLARTVGDDHEFGTLAAYHEFAPRLRELARRLNRNVND